MTDTNLVDRIRLSKGSFMECGQVVLPGDRST